MTSRFAITALALACGLGSIALAEPVLVRSGAHGSFTRLVFDLPQGARWELDQSSSAPVIRLSGNIGGFDLSQTYQKITRDRIGSVTPISPKSARIDLACECDVKAMMLGNGMLVVDVHDQSDQSAQRQDFSPTRNSMVTPVSSVMRLSFGEGETLGVPQVEPEKILSKMNKPMARPNQETDSSIQLAKRVSGAEQRLLEQIARAATQGLLTPNTKAVALPAVSPSIAVISSQPDALSPGEMGEKAQRLEPLTAGVNLRAQTSVDRDFLTLLGDLPQTLDGATCLTEVDLDVRVWADDTSFGAQLGQWRTKLMGEFDRQSAETVRKMAQFYLHYGFGAEAAHVLNIAELPEREKAVLSTLAQIMEFGVAGPMSPLNGQLDCDTPAAFWAALATPTLPRGASLDTTSMLRTLSALPPHLRSHLGPILADRLLAAGKINAAADVVRLIERGGQSDDPRLQMAEAKLRLANGELPAAEKSLDTVVEANAEMSPEALVKLIDVQIAQGKAIAPDLARLAEAFAQELRGQPIAGELHRVYVLALAGSGQFERAFMALEEHWPNHSGPHFDELRSDVLSKATEIAADMVFVEYALANARHAGSRITTQAANQIAERLINLGFASYAAPYLSSGADGAEGRARRLLRAEIALADLRPRRAEADILGLSGPDIDLLRARARAMAGDHDAAQAVFRTLDATTQADQEAWLASNWEALIESDDPMMAEVAEMMLNKRAESVSLTDLVDTPPVGVLAANSALLAESIASRGTMQALLNTLEVDTALGN